MHFLQPNKIKYNVNWFFLKYKITEQYNSLSIGRDFVLQWNLLALWKGKLYASWFILNQQGKPASNSTSGQLPESPSIIVMDVVNVANTLSCKYLTLKKVSGGRLKCNAGCWIFGFTLWLWFSKQPSWI